MTKRKYTGITVSLYENPHGVLTLICRAHKLAYTGLEKVEHEPDFLSDCEAMADDNTNDWTVARTSIDSIYNDDRLAAQWLDGKIVFVNDDLGFNAKRYIGNAKFRSEVTSEDRAYQEWLLYTRRERSEESRDLFRSRYIGVFDDAESWILEHIENVDLCHGWPKLAIEYFNHMAYADGLILSGEVFTIRDDELDLHFFWAR